MRVSVRCMSDATKVTSIEGTFLLPPSPKRRKLAGEMIKTLALSEPENLHVLAAGFIEKGRPDFFYVHIDYAQARGKTKGAKAARDYFVTISLRERPTSTPPESIRKRTQGIQWAMENISAFLGTSEAICFLDARLTMQNRERPPLPRPIVIDDEVVPAIGAEYAIPSRAKGLRRLRWSMESPPGRLVQVWLSYALPHDGSSPLDQWLAEAQNLLIRTAEGAIPNA